MAGKQGWDLSSTHSLEGGVAWLRKRAGALLVLVVRGDEHGNDFAVAVDPQVAPGDVWPMTEEVLPAAMERLEQMRLEARARAKVKKAQQGS